MFVDTIYDMFPGVDGVCFIKKGALPSVNLYKQKHKHKHKKRYSTHCRVVGELVTPGGLRDKTNQIVVERIDVTIQDSCLGCMDVHDITLTRHQCNDECLLGKVYLVVQISCLLINYSTSLHMVGAYH